MKTQEIGQSGMIASRVALGVMRMDALDAADAARTVAVAHDSGIDYFDTADIYGSMIMPRTPVRSVSAKRGRTQDSTAAPSSSKPSSASTTVSAKTMAAPTDMTSAPSI